MTLNIYYTSDQAFNLLKFLADNAEYHKINLSHQSKIDVDTHAITVEVTRHYLQEVLPNQLNVTIHEQPYQRYRCDFNDIEAHILSKD